MQVYTPNDLQACPFIAVVFRDQHTHPIPLPTRTPAPVVSWIGDLLRGMGHHLADTTPLRFSRFGSVKHALRSLFPDVLTPTLIDLHPSLANNDHLRVLINKEKKKLYPLGTDWDGALLRLPVLS